MSTTNDSTRLNEAFNVVRSLQLEGTYSGTTSPGGWPLSAIRTSFGWGAIQFKDWDYELSDSLPPEPPPHLDAIAKKLRSHAYCRVLDACDARTLLRRGYPVVAAIRITPDWFDAPGGVIPELGQHPVFVSNHVVTVVMADPPRSEGGTGPNTLCFQNSWGNWGDRGLGYITDDCFDRSLLEGWAQVGPIGPNRPSSASANGVLMHNVHNIHDRIIYVLQVFDFPTDERRAWAIAVQRGGLLRIDDLLVRPAYRRRGLGSTLVRRLEELAASIKCVLRFDVPFVDSKPTNRKALIEFFGRNRYRVEPAKVPWAGYTAVRGEIQEVPEVKIPDAPTAPRPDERQLELLKRMSRIMRRRWGALKRLAQ